MIALYLMQLAAPPVGAQPAEEEAAVPHLLDVRAEGDQIVLELSQLLPYKTTTLSSPWRLIVEIPGALYRAGFSKRNLDLPLVRRVRGYQFKETPLISRVVLDLNAPVDFKSDVSGSNIILTLKKNELLDDMGNAAADPESSSTAAAPAETKKRSSAPPKRARDLLNSLPKEVVTLDFEGADIRDVIRLMAETSNINIIYGPEVGGTISIHLKKVPFDQAFGTIMNLKGLVATQLGENILRVTTPDVLKKEQDKAVVFTKSIAVNYLKADDMQRHIQAVMSSAGRKGTITVVQETNSIVVTDSQEGIAQAERLVGQLDKRPQQVMIEARLVEINIDNGFDMGVQWEYLNARTSGNRTNFIGSATDDDPRLSFDGAPLFGGEDGFGASGPPDGTGVSFPRPTTGGAITFGFIDDSSLLAASLSALVTQSKAKILSAPKVVTVNGQQAKIEAVQDIPFETAVISPTGSLTDSFQFVSAGIILTVTPTINAEDRITLRVQPESSFPTADSTEAGPVIATRKAQTTVSIKDGDTLVIGGLINDEDTKGVAKVPILGDIPIIGVFFRNSTTRKIRRELLVFVTPRIIRE